MPLTHTHKLHNILLTHSPHTHRVTSTTTSGGVWSMHSLSGLTRLSSSPHYYYLPATVSYCTIVPSTWGAGQDASTIRIQACEWVVCFFKLTQLQRMNSFLSWCKQPSSTFTNDFMRLMLHCVMHYICVYHSIVGLPM